MRLSRPSVTKIIRSLCYGLMFAILATLLCASSGKVSTGQQITCAHEQGWFVRVCEPKTEAPDGIDIWIGVGGNESTHRFWKRWHHGDATDFQFPVDLVRAKEVWFKGQTANDGKNVYLGFGFNGRIIKHLDMDGSPEEYEQSRGDDTDEFDCP